MATDSDSARELTESQELAAAADGVSLFLRRRRPEAPRASIAVIHGYAEHEGRYGELAEALNRAGYEVWTIDLRGHGLSEGLRGYCARFDDYLHDLDLLAARLRESSPDRPWGLIAHSMGGLAATRWLQARDAKAEGVGALLLSAPFFALSLKVPPIKRKAAELLAGVWPTFALPNELRAEHLSRDPEKQAAWAADQALIRAVPARWFVEALAAQERASAEASRITLPLRVHHGEADPVADPAVSREVSARFGSHDKAWRGWPGLVHEIFNEPERAEVFSEVVGWFDEAL